MVVSLPENATGRRNLDFAKHYRNGCDVVVYATQSALDRMARACAESDGKTLSAATIARYHQNGLSAFLPFCATMSAALKRELRLDDIDRQFIDEFIARFCGSRMSACRARRFDTQPPRRYWWRWENQAGSPEIFFRAIPFRTPTDQMKGQTALSEPEGRSVLQALKADMRAIIKGSGPLTSEELAVCLLAIAARTGINPTPALELLTDCLQPHPIKSDRYVLVSFKRRGNATHIQSLRRAADVESMVSALPDVACIIDLVRERNDTIRQSSNSPAFLFVYESLSRKNAGKMGRLAQHTLTRGIKAFLDRH